MKVYFFRAGIFLWLVVNVWVPVSAQGKRWEDWQNIAAVKPGERVAVYLRSGGRIAEAFHGYDAERITLRSGSIEKDRILVVTLPAHDRLLNGALIGAAAGFAVMAAATAPVEDFAEGAWVIFGVAGAGGGSGIGALLDAGTGTPEKIIYASGPETGAISSRRWRLRIPPEGVFNWTWNRTVDLMLKDGTYIRGQVEAGDQGHVVIRINDSSLRSLEGVQRIQTVSISTIIYKEKLKASTAAAVLGGGFAGLFLGAIGGLASSDAANEGPRAAGGGIAGAVVGTVTGVALSERNWREITLVVKPSSEP